MRVCVVISFILDVRLVDAPAGVTQEEGHTGFFHLPSVVLALIFIAGRIQPSLPSSTMQSNFVYPRTNRSTLVGHEGKSQFVLLHRDSNSRPNVRRFSRLLTDPPGRPALGGTFECLVILVVCSKIRKRPGHSFWG